MSTLLHLIVSRTFLLLTDFCVRNFYNHLCNVPQKNSTTSAYALEVEGEYYHIDKLKIIVGCQPALCSPTDHMFCRPDLNVLNLNIAGGKHCLPSCPMTKQTNESDGWEIAREEKIKRFHSIQGKIK